jgi:hypothetical protein
MPVALQVIITVQLHDPDWHSCCASRSCSDACGNHPNPLSFCWTLLLSPLRRAGKACAAFDYFGGQFDQTRLINRD